MRLDSWAGFAESWMAGMWTACWQGGLLILAVWGLCRLFPRLNPSIRQGLWWMACLKLLLAVVWVRPVTLQVLPLSARPIHSALERMTPPISDYPVQSAFHSATLDTVPWQQAILAVWLIGVAVNLLAAARSAVIARQLIRSAYSVEDQPIGAELRELAIHGGLSRAPRLMLSPLITSPCVVGHFRPTVLAPETMIVDLSAEERRMALAHEIAHLRRRDLWLAVVPSLAFSFFYFFPPVWLACREWATDRESSCDQEAIRATGAKPSAYGGMLMKVASGDHRRIIPGLGATAQFHTLKRRMSEMINASHRSRAPWIGSVLLFIGALFLMPWSVTAQTVQSGLVRTGAWAITGDPPGFVMEMDSKNSRSGNPSFLIKRSEDLYWPIAEWSQEIAYDGQAKALEFGAWIKAENEHKAVLDVQFVDVAGIRTHRWVAYVGAMDDGAAPVTHDWARYSGVTPIPPGTRRIYVAFQGYGPGAAWIDDAFARYVQNGDLK